MSARQNQDGSYRVRIVGAGEDYAGAPVAPADLPSMAVQLRGLESVLDAFIEDNVLWCNALGYAPWMEKIADPTWLPPTPPKKRSD